MLRGLAPLLAARAVDAHVHMPLSRNVDVIVPVLPHVNCGYGVGREAGSATHPQ